MGAFKKHHPGNWNIPRSVITLWLQMTVISSFSRFVFKLNQTKLKRERRPSLITPLCKMVIDASCCPTHNKPTGIHGEFLTTISVCISDYKIASSFSTFINVHLDILCLSRCVCECVCYFGAVNVENFWFYLWVVYIPSCK